MFSPITSMGLDCCKLIDSQAGWVSDHYLSFIRIIKWIYSYFVTTERSVLLKSELNNIEHCLVSLVSTESYAMSKEVSLKITPMEMKRGIKKIYQVFIILIYFYITRESPHWQKEILLIG